MKKIKIFTLLLCLGAFFVACNKDDDGPDVPQPREQVGRTVLVYIVGDNGANELSSLFEDNFRDMKEGMKDVDYSKCNLIVYSELVNDVPRLISVKKKSGKVVADTLFTYPEQNPLEKKVMSAIISQTVSYFPADSYGFVFLSHSSSWVPVLNNANSRSIGYYRRTQMDIPDFRDALQSSFPKPLKFILFDCCNMQSVEVAYELRECADYFIGSPAEIPGPGAPYQRVVPEFFTETDLAKNIANAYFGYYEEHYKGTIPKSNDDWTGGVATSVVESAALDHLAAATKSVLKKYIEHRSDIIRVGIQRYDFTGTDANYDLDGFIQTLTGGTDNADYKSWRTAFDNAVVFWETTPQNYSGIIYRMFSMEKATGLSTYIPYGEQNSTMNVFYPTLEWYSAAGWNDIAW